MADIKESHVPTSIKTLLVTGATGHQGSAVIHHLLSYSSPSSRDFLILALTRNASSPSAKRLAELSPKVKPVEGNLDFPEKVFEKAEDILRENGVKEGIWGVFSVQVAIGTTPAQEESQGKSLINVSLKHGAKHFIYASVDRGGHQRSLQNPTPVPHFASKYNIEQHLISTCSVPTRNPHGMGWTIVRPVAFVDFFKPGFMGRLSASIWKHCLPEDKPLQFVWTKDIGYFAASAFLDPDAYTGKALSIAGMSLTFSEADRIFRERLGYALPIAPKIFAKVAFLISPNLKKLWEWLGEEGYKAEIENCKRRYPEMMVNWGEYLEKESGFLSKM